jgi:hypothetical protein
MEKVIITSWVSTFLKGTFVNPAIRISFFVQTIPPAVSTNPLQNHFISFLEIHFVLLSCTVSLGDKFLSTVNWNLQWKDFNVNMYKYKKYTNWYAGKTGFQRFIRRNNYMIICVKLCNWNWLTPTLFVGWPKLPDVLDCLGLIG